MTFKLPFETPAGVKGYIEVAVRGASPSITHPLLEDPDFKLALEKMRDAASAAFERSEEAIVMQTLERQTTRRR